MEDPAKKILQTNFLHYLFHEDSFDPEANLEIFLLYLGVIYNRRDMDGKVILSTTKNIKDTVLFSDDNITIPNHIFNITRRTAIKRLYQLSDKLDIEHHGWKLSIKININTFYMKAIQYDEVSISIIDNKVPNWKRRLRNFIN